MKKLLRSILVNLTSFWFLGSLTPIISVSTPMYLLLAAIIFTLLNLIVKPAVKIILLPFNLITFGFLTWLPSVIILYFTTLLTSSFQINSFSLPSYNLLGLVVPPLHFGRFSAVIVASILLTLTRKVVLWALRKDK